MAMIKCASCGRSVSDSDVKCPYCGEKTNNTMYCPKCNSKNVGFEAEFGDSVGYRMKKSLFGGILFRKNDDGVNIKYVCKDCGKKFKVK